ncbi:MAG: GGDEF domain-containing protein [Halioglobus sp.]|nr:GGDEF domain-containing protein [Halioglobus sp.]
MQWYPAALLKLLLPIALIVAAYLSRTRVEVLSPEFGVLIDNLPYLFCFIAVLMAYQFNRCRLMLAAFSVGVFYWVIRTYLQVSLSEPTAWYAYLSLSLALPVLCFYLLLLPERGIWNFNGFVFSLAFVMLALICVQLGPWLPEVNQTAFDYYTPRPVEGYVLSRGVTLLVVLTAIVGLVLLCVRDDEVEVAILGPFFALYVTLALLHLEYMSVVMCSAAGLCLVWGLLRSSHAMAYKDDLTSLPGRRALNERLKMLGRQYSIAMLDIDHFKKFNDTYGHDVGDEVLRLVASRIRRVGAGGTAYRYGGEEFCIVFPRREVVDCAPALEAVRKEIADYKMSLRDKTLRPLKGKEGSKRRGATRLRADQVSVTVSAGLAARGAKALDASAVIAAADKQLYRAKKAGRNRVAHA